MAIDFMAKFGYMQQSVVWKRLAISPFRYKKNIQWQYISYILCKYDENRSSNPRDYEGNKCTFMDETAKIGLSHQISHQTARPIFTNASALVMYVWGLQNLHKFRGSPWDVAIVTDQFWGLFAGVKIDRHYSLLSLSKTECIIALRIRVLIVALIALHCLKRWWKSVQ